MTAAEQVDALCARLTTVLSELECDVPLNRPSDLAVIEDQIAALCRDLTDRPAAEREAALGKLRPLAEKLDRIEHRVERHLAELHQRIDAAGSRSDRSGG